MRLIDIEMALKYIFMDTIKIKQSFAKRIC